MLSRNGETHPSMSQAPKLPKREKVDGDEAYVKFHVLVLFLVLYA